MRKLKIETYSRDTGILQDSISIPFGLAKILVKMLPRNIARKFDENRESLEALINVIKDTESLSSGVLFEFEDIEDNERIVFRSTELDGAS